MIVDAEIDQHIVHPAIAALRAHDIDGGRLPAALVTAGLVARSQCGHQASGELTLRHTESGSHRIDSNLADQDIALAGEAVADMMPGPWVASGSGMRRRAA